MMPSRADLSGSGIKEAGSTGKAYSLAEAGTKFAEAGKIDGDPNLSDPGRSFPLSEAALPLTQLGTGLAALPK